MEFKFRKVGNGISFIVIPLIIIFFLAVTVFAQGAINELDINQTLGINLTSVMKGRSYESEAGVDIDTELLTAFLLYNQTEVYTCFQLRDSSNITYEGASTDEQIRNVWESQKLYFANLSKEVLENLREDEFAAERDESVLKMSSCGTMTQKGLIKLAQDQRIDFIAIPLGGNVGSGINESINSEVSSHNKSNTTSESSSELTPTKPAKQYLVIAIIIILILSIIILKSFKKEK